jgi:hypothetical protein
VRLRAGGKILFARHWLVQVLRKSHSLRILSCPARHGDQASTLRVSTE